MPNSSPVAADAGLPYSDKLDEALDPIVEAATVPLDAGVATNSPDAPAVPEMTRDEMRAALGEAGDSQPGVEVGAEIKGEKAVKAKPASETALLQDKWSLRKGAQVLDESDRLKEMFGVTAKSKPMDAAGRKKWNQERRDAELQVADFHTAAFEPEPVLAEKCKNERISQYMRNLMETPEFKALHQETQLDEMSAEIATAQFATGWVELRKKDKPSDEFQADMQAMAAAANAIKGAHEEITDLNNACAALGCGKGAGGKGKTNAKALTDMFKRVKNSRDLKRICDLAGRYRLFAQAQQRKKVLHGRDDVVGVMLDGDLGKMLPQELVAFDDPDLELDAMRKVIERQTLCRDYQGVEKQARGPIVVVVDESGSMSGEPIHTAKAIALALAWVARSQNRWYALVGFSGGTGGVFCVCPPNGIPSYRDFEDKSQTDWKSAPDGLMDWLEHFYSGGTTLDVPLDMLPRQWENIQTPRGKTDIIVITDAAVDVPDHLRDSFLEWKDRENVKMITLVIGNDAGEMPKVSDKTHCVKNLGMDQDGVAEALSV